MDYDPLYTGRRPDRKGVLSRNEGWIPSEYMEDRKDIDPFPLGTRLTRRHAFVMTERKPKRYEWNLGTLLYYYPHQKLRDVERWS